MASCFCTVGQPGVTQWNLLVTSLLHLTALTMQITLPHLHFAVIKCWDGSSALPFMCVRGYTQREYPGSQYRERLGRRPAESRMKGDTLSLNPLLLSKFPFLIFMLSGDADKCCDGSRPSLTSPPAAKS